MPRGNSETTNHTRTEELLKSILILQLGLAAVPQTSIRKIMGCSMNRVNDILKHLPKRT